jgi:hypothetical protein
MEKTVHFHHSDERFCGSKKQFRRFSLDPNEITCRKCASKDTFVLSDEASRYVARLSRSDRNHCP